MLNLRMLTLNTNGIRHTPKRRALFKDLRDTKSDIFFLQETHSSIHDCKIWKSEWGGEAIFAHGRSNARGVAILFARDLNFTILHQRADLEGRYILLKIQIDGKTATLVNIYAPTQNYPSEQIQLMDTIEDLLSDFEVQHAFFTGDLNIQLDPEQRQPTDNQKATPNTRDNYADKIYALTETYNTIDIWQKKNPKSGKGTFRRNAYTSRLDYWFIPLHLENCVTSISILPTPLSDHSMVVLEIGLPNEQRGPGFWQFNKTLLTDQKFLQEMKNHIQLTLDDHFENPQLRWEWIKFKIRQFCIQFCIRRNRETKSHIKELNLQLVALAKDLDEYYSDDTWAAYQSIKRELSEIKQHQANGAIFRTRANWTMAGEKPTAYFLGLEKRKSKGKTISVLQDNQGHLLTNNKDILNHGKQFFQIIYTEDPSSLTSIHETTIFDTPIPQITELSRTFMNRPFSQQEFASALKDLNANKTPGSDGLSVEFYQKFWELLQIPFYDSVNYSLEIGQLSEDNARD